MQPDEITTLFDYTYWARDQLMAAAEGLPDEEFLRDRGFTYGSLRGMLVHSMEAEAVWTARFLGEPVALPLGDDELTSVESLKLHWQAQEARLRRFLPTVTESLLRDDFVFRRRDGVEMRAPLWTLLLQVVNHGTQHRSEAAEVLTMLGRSPGNLDLLTFLW
jgi:uncharacterized damage-inducible protein DinB